MFNKPKIRDYRNLNNVKGLPFEELAESTTIDYQALVEDFSDRYALSIRPWVYPQLLAEVGTWSYSRIGDKIDSLDFLAKNCKNSPRNKGIYWFLMWDSRALDKQYLHTEFCGLTPLIPSAFKKLHGINYSEWDSPHRVINPKLMEAISVDYPAYTVDELLQFRVTGLTINSGKKVGTIKNAAVTHNLYNLPKALVDGRVGPGVLPQLTRMMLCQTWCAHPKHRNKYSILDPKDWDSMPEPLVDETPLSDPKPSVTPELDVPW